VGGHPGDGHVTDVCGRRVECEEHPVRLRGGGEVDRRLGEVEARLGEADELHGARGRLGDEQRHGVGHPDVLRRSDHQPPGDESGVLPGRKQMGEPVQGGVHVGAPDALDERAGHVVVVVDAVPEGSRPESVAGVIDADRQVDTA